MFLAFDPTLSTTGSARCGERAGSSASSLVSRTLPLPCTAAVSSLQPSLLGGLTSASVASADTTATFDSSPSLLQKAYSCVECTSAWHGCGGIAQTDRRAGARDDGFGALGLEAEAAPAVAKRASASAPPPPSPPRATVDLDGSAAVPCTRLATLDFLCEPVAAPHTAVLVVPLDEHEEEGLPPSVFAAGPSDLCCGPPPLIPSEEARRATTAESFLQHDVPPTAAEQTQTQPTVTMEGAAPLTRRLRSRVRVPCSLVYPAARDAVEVDVVSSPAAAAVASVSPTTCSTVTNSFSMQRSRSFDTPLPHCASCTSAEDVSGLRYPDQRTAPSAEGGVAHQDDERQRSALLHATSRPQRTQPQPYPQHYHHRPQQRHVWPHCGPCLEPVDSAVTLSALTTPVTNTSTGAPFSPVGEDGSGARTGGMTGATSSSSLRSYSSPQSPAPGVGSTSCGGAAATTANAFPSGSGGALPRVRSMDTVATLSSTRSRPALTPAATGLPATTTASMAGSTAASVTVTSVTYTRKNVSLGALDFYGNPITSLSTLLAQMSVRSGDRDELEQLEARQHVSPQQQQQPSQQHHRNTLSMQNLKAHTQQVGVMGTEDKIKRLRGKSETVTATTSMLRRRRSSCPFPGVHPSSASNAAATAATSSASKPQVDCLKDVLQECNFLCINDVINAIADTQAHELQEAQQQLEAAGCPAPTLSCLTAAAAAAAAGSGGGEESSAAAGVPAADTLPSPQLQRTPSLPMSAWSEEMRSPILRGANGGGSFCCVSTTCVPALHPSADAIDPQQALSLAAAMTEVSLNLDRSSEVSTSVSTLVTNASRLNGLRPASVLTAACPVCDRASPSLTSGSLPNMATDSVVESGQPSVAATVAPLRPAAQSTMNSRGPASPAEVAPSCHCEATAFPDDPLERKVLRSCVSDAPVDAATRSSALAGSSESDRAAQPPLMVLLPPSPATAPSSNGADGSSTGGVQMRERGTERRLRASAPPCLAPSGRYVPSWYGLSSNGGDGEAAVKSPQLPPEAEETDCFARSIIMGDLDEMGDCGVADVSTQVRTGAVKSAAEVRVVIESISCASFDDEVTTVRELRRWARCVAQQELLQPSTETEVTT